MSGESFKIGSELKPDEIYYAAVGAILSEGYRSVKTVSEEEQEYCQVFIDERLKRQPIILYYPGRDGSWSANPNQDFTPEFTLNHVLKKAREEFVLETNPNAQHLIIIADSMKRYSHYVLARMDKSDLRMDISNVEPYNEGPALDIVKEAFPENSKPNVVRSLCGWPAEPWQSGYNMIAAVHNIAGGHTPAHVYVNDKTIAQSRKFYLNALPKQQNNEVAPSQSFFKPWMKDLAVGVLVAGAFVGALAATIATGGLSAPATIPTMVCAGAAFLVVCSAIAVTLGAKLRSNAAKKDSVEQQNANNANRDHDPVVIAAQSRSTYANVQAATIAQPSVRNSVLNYDVQMGDDDDDIARTVARAPSVRADARMDADQDSAEGSITAASLPSESYQP